VLEATDAERSDLEQRFGPAVSDLVVAVSDDPAIPNEEARKDGLRGRVQRESGYALAVYAADKISKGARAPRSDGERGSARRGREQARAPS
jgi:(p)ppGpp synthase/HD superfamily hydrolase